MTQNQISTDGGKTWQDMPLNLRIIFREVAEDDDEIQDLQVVLTHEGLIFDLIGQVSGEVVKTAAWLAMDIPETLK
jgi:hypothetical protein